MTYEYFNKKVDERKAAVINAKKARVNEQKERTLDRLIRILAPVAGALLLVAILESIGCISNIFSYAIMIAILCTVSFKLGRVWHKLKF